MSIPIILLALQMTYIELDTRVTALEENGGSVIQNGTRNLYFNRPELVYELQNVDPLFFTSDTIAFHTVLTSYSSMSGGSPVLFNDVLLNLDDG